MISLKKIKFYYADRNKREPVKCEVQDVKFDYPATIFEKREDAGEIL